jgi:hypothetical protein
VTRRLKLLIPVLLLALVAWSVSRVPVWSRGLLARGLQSFFHRPASVGEVRFRLFPVEVEIRDVRVSGYTPEAAPFLEVPRVEVVPSLRSLWAHPLVLSRVRLEGLRLRVNAFPRGGDDIPKMGGEGGGGEVRIRRLVIAGGEFILDHRRVPLELDLPSFEGRLLARRGAVLAGRIGFGPGPLRFGTAPTLPVSTEIDLNLEGRLLTVESAHLRAEGTDLAYTGEIRLQARPQGAFHLRGPVSLDMLDRHVMRTGFGVKGDARFDGTLTVDGSRLAIKGRMEGRAGEFDAVPVPEYGGDISWDGNGVRLRGLEVETLGGSGRIDLDVPPGPAATSRLAATMSGADAEGLVTAIFDIGEPHLAGAVTGETTLTWPKGRFRRGLSGRIAVDIAPREDERRPLSGRFEWRAEDGVQFVENADLHTPATHARLQGRVEVDDRADLAVDGESTDLADTDDLLAKLRRALGTPEAQPAGFSGAGSFRGHWGGTLQFPVFDGRFSGHDVGYLGVVWGQGDWAGVADPKVVRSRSLVLRRPGGELSLEGTMETGYWGEQDGVDVRVRFRDWPAADFTEAMDWDLDLSGLLSGEAAVAGRRSAPRGAVRVTSAAGRYYRVPYRDLDVRSLLHETVSEVTSGRASVGGGTVTFAGTLTEDGVFDGRAGLRGVDVGDVIPPVAPQVAWGGRVSGDVTVQGTLERPRLAGRLASPRLFVGDEGLGALEATVFAKGDGAVAVDATCRSPRVDLALSGTVGAAPPYTAALRVKSRETSLDPFARVVAPTVPAGLGILASGDVEIQGPLLDPGALAVEAAATDVLLLLPDYPVRNREPLRLSMRDGRVLVRDFRLSGEGTDLVLGGSADVARDGALALSLRGNADLRALQALSGRIRGLGAARLGLDLTGTLRAPEMRGALELDGAGLRVRGFPHGLEAVRGTVRFTETAIDFADVTGTLGGGTVEMDGRADYASGRLTSFDMSASGRGLTFRYPEGLRSVVDADLRLFGDALRQWATGTIDVRQALWTRRYDVASELLAASPVRETAPSLTEGLRYDIKVRAPGTLRVDNNLATLTARADLSLQGSYDVPVVLGRAEIEGGRVYFQGNTYVIRHGTLDFANPQRTDPLFDIEAETRLRTYRVTLKVNGTLERVYPTLTSDPPLSAIQILNLLAGAEESTVASLTQAQTEQARLAATGAATLAAGRISEEVGLEREAERLFGLNRFSIDPSLVKGGASNPTARLTVGKRLTPDLNVLYSVDLRGTEDRLISVEYTLSDRLSLLLTQSEPGGLGFDLRLRHSR